MSFTPWEVIWIVIGSLYAILVAIWSVAVWKVRPWNMDLLSNRANPQADRDG